MGENEREGQKVNGFIILALIGLVLQVYFSYINAGYRNPINGISVGFAISFLAAAGVWWFRVFTPGKLEYANGWAAYALAAWLPILIYFISPELIPWYAG